MGELGRELREPRNYNFNFEGRASLLSGLLPGGVFPPQSVKANPGHGYRIIRHLGGERLSFPHKIIGASAIQLRLIMGGI